jgi:CHAD domain-containing protein
MAFSIKRGESVTKAIPRVGCDRIERARDCLQHAARPEAIHGARKEIKKARAALRLARPVCSKKGFRRIAQRLQKAAGELAPARDAAIKTKTLRDLARRFKRDLPPGGFRKLRIELRRASNKEIDRLNKQAKQTADRLLKRAAKDFQRLALEADGWKAIAAGLKRSYRHSRRTYQHALTTPAPEAFHKWRKRAKDLWYQILLLEQIWPEQLNRMACELETVGDFLGEDHDLFVLQEWLREAHPNGREATVLHKFIANRQGELRAKALATGKYFYGETPSVFCKRLAGYWRTWQRNRPA